MAITVPPVRGAGDLGHVDDSNTVRQALLDLEAMAATADYGRVDLTSITNPDWQPAQVFIHRIGYVVTLSFGQLVLPADPSAPILTIPSGYVPDSNIGFAGIMDRVSLWAWGSGIYGYSNGMTPGGVLRCSATWIVPTNSPSPSAVLNPAAYVPGPPIDPATGRPTDA